MTTTNLNISPFYDDYKNQVVDSGNYEHTKGFNQILFKPGYAVQARELTQIQSILKDQIAQFGSHIFKHGSVVIPGNVTSDLNACYVKLTATYVDITTLINKKLTGSVTGLSGYVRVVDTATNTIYVSYYNTGLAGEAVFQDSETLSVENSSVTVDVGLSAGGISAVGGASLAFITRGVFFVNGSFVSVEKQSIVIDNTPTPTKSVRLKITESIVSSDEDLSLLDPAQGTNNFAAPGSDRLRVELTLVAVEPDSEPITTSYVELMRFNVGVLEEHLRYAKYNELEKSLARRTYDESGNYVVTGLDISAREHLLSTINNGKYLPELGGDESKFVLEVSPGKAYINGYEVENIAAKAVAVDKSREFSTTDTSIVPAYGQYIYVTGPVALPDFKSRQTIVLTNSFTGGSNIGTAKVLAIDLHESGTTSEDSIWRLYITDLALNAGSDIADIGKITYAGGSMKCVHKYQIIPASTALYAKDNTVKDLSNEAIVHLYVSATNTLYVYKNSTTLNIPGVNSIITAYDGDSPLSATGRISSIQSIVSNIGSSLVFSVSDITVKSVTDEVNSPDITYKFYKQSTVTTSTQTCTISVSGMTVDPIEQGNITIVSDLGVVYTSSVATLDPTGTTITIDLGLVPASPVTLSVVFACSKSAANFGTKLSASITQTGLAQSEKIMLSQADGIELSSVIIGTADVTSKYMFNGGQTDYSYDSAYLVPVPGAVIPAGTLTVVYKYFQHSGSADYFCIDSYADSGLVDYRKSVSLIYTSRDTGLVYDLRKCLDFRTKSVELNRFIPQIDSRITTSVQTYLSRYDSVVCDQSGKVTVITGKSAQNPVLSQVSPDLIHLGTVYIPPYTPDVTAVEITKVSNKAYTMAAIGKLESRLTNLEDYVLLSQQESDVVNYDVIDSATGLNRYKSGYLVDTFLDADKISDITSRQFQVTYDSGSVIPQFESIMVHLDETVGTYADVQISGTASDGFITLPYTEVVMAKQPVSSKITNINPFAVFSWTGTMQIVPTSDTWVVTQNLQDIVTNTTETIVNTIFVQRAAPVPPQFAAPATVRLPVPVVRPASQPVVFRRPFEQGGQGGRGSGI